MDNELSKKLDELAEDYVNILHQISNFISVYNLDEEEVWDYLNQAYDDDLTYAPGDN